jgi:hypothetical protein
MREKDREEFYLHRGSKEEELIKTVLDIKMKVK